LLLSAIGTYGVVNYSVSRQLPGLGIRLALGAVRRNILRLVLTDGLRFILIGISAGLICSLFATQFISSLIWGVSPFDPVSFAIVAVVLGLIGLAACARPAWRASRIDPMVVLRHE
jgi:ABC-type antimicrobial peptide transport system permease subunit